ncbi:hypothetical protein ACFQZ4_52440 [Catellatospora coxensis]
MRGTVRQNQQTTDPYRQTGHRVRVGWGPQGPTRQAPAPRSSTCCRSPPR